MNDRVELALLPVLTRLQRCTSSPAFFDFTCEICRCWMAARHRSV